MNICLRYLFYNLNAAIKYNFQLVYNNLYLLHFTYLNLFLDCQVSKRFFRKDYTYLLSTDNFYKIHTVPRTWGEAKVRCALEGAKLFYPQDANEAEAVIRLSTETQPFNWMFVGFTKAIAKEVFETIDGQLLAHASPLTSLASYCYTSNWHVFSFFLPLHLSKLEVSLNQCLLIFLY